MHVHISKRLTVLLASLALAALVSPSMAACGSSAKTNQGSPTLSTDDASDSVVASASGGDADIGNAMFTTAADGGGPLQVHIQVNGNDGVCGACAVVLAQTQGGTQPYSYAWSDPSWSGPGPFTICPESTTPVSVTATDSSGSSTGELSTGAQTAQAATSVACTPSDGSTPEAGGLNGCVAAASSGTPDAGTNDAGLYECQQNEVEAGVAWTDGGAVASEAAPLGYTFLAGHTYSVSYDRLLPIELGQAVTVDVFGSTAPDICETQQKLFTLTLDGSIFNWHQSYCFTPDRDYQYVVTNVYIQGVLIYINPLSVSTICDSCTQ